MKRNATFTDFEVIQEYPTFYFGWALLEGKRLYKTSKEKRRTAAENAAIIAKQSHVVQERMPNEPKKRIIVTPEQVREVRQRIADGQKYSFIAQEMDLNSSTVSGIGSGKTHKDVL